MTREEYKMEMDKLDEAEFIAEMSDSYAVTVAEKKTIAKKRAALIRRAKEEGII